MTKTNEFVVVVFSSIIAVTIGDAVSSGTLVNCIGAGLGMFVAYTWIRATLGQG